MFKLLYYLDFLHFKETGRPVTNQNYSAWKFGPAPKDLWLELKDGKVPKDFKSYLTIETYKLKEDRQGSNFKAKKSPDLSVFTPREKDILEKVSFIFKDVTPTQVTEISHLPNQPWDKTIKEKGEGALIDYFLALDKDALVSEEEAKEIQKEREEMFRNFPIKPTIE